MNATFLKLTNRLILLGLLTAPCAYAGSGCETIVESTDAMSFNTKKIEVPKSCKEFTVTLKHTGKLGKSVMGHNLVIAKAADQQGVLDDGNKAGVASDFLKANDVRVIAATKIIGGGESATTKFTVSKLEAKASYVFFCSYPGHAFMMKGAISVL